MGCSDNALRNYIFKFSLWACRFLSTVAKKVQVLDWGYSFFIFAVCSSVLCDVYGMLVTGYTFESKITARSCNNNVLVSNSGKCFVSKTRPTKRAPDAGDSAAISSSFLRLIIFPVGRLRRPRPSAGNANR